MIFLASSGSLVPVGFLATCLWFFAVLPVRLRRGDVAFLRTFKFLLVRFRPGAQWYVLVLLLRNTFFVIVPTLPNATVQLLCLAIILLPSIITGVCVCVLRVRIWTQVRCSCSRSETLNLGDSVSLRCPRCRRIPLARALGEPLRHRDDRRISCNHLPRGSVRGRCQQGCGRGHPCRSVRRSCVSGPDDGFALHVDVLFATWQEERRLPVPPQGWRRSLCASTPITFGTCARSLPPSQTRLAHFCCSAAPKSCRDRGVWER